MPIENAEIKEAKLSIDGHVHPVFMLVLQHGPNVWTVGPYRLREYSLADALGPLLRIARARDWSGLKGSHVRMETDEAGNIVRLAHILHDDYWVPESYLLSEEAA